MIPSDILLYVMWTTGLGLLVIHVGLFLRCYILLNKMPMEFFQNKNITGEILMDGVFTQVLAYKPTRVLKWTLAITWWLSLFAWFSTK